MDEIGTFRWRPGDDRWTWDDALFRLHGYEPGSVTPTGALLLAHAHPQDRDRVADAVTALAVARRPYSARHRLVSASGRTREIVGAGAAVGEADQGPELRGFLIPLDVDPAPAARSARVDAAEVVIPGPRGPDGPEPAEPLTTDLAGVVELPLPAGRSGELADARHAAALRRANDVLVAGLELSREAAATVVVWLANTHEVPPVIVAESLASVRRDEDGRPDLTALLTILDGGP